MKGWVVVGMLAAFAPPALAGPPYVSDDPEPTDYRRFEIYTFASGTHVRDGTAGETGIDFNYGAVPDLQLTAVVPAGYAMPDGGAAAWGLGNVELAAKYRFLHQETAGWDVAIFPRVFLPSNSPAVGRQHGSLLLPFWLEKDWQDWSTFGGGGCALNSGEGDKNFCLAGWALTRQVSSALRIGAEIFHQTADTKGGRSSTGVGLGFQYDLSDHFHLLASGGPGIQNAASTNVFSWYSALLLTF